MSEALPCKRKGVRVGVSLVFVCLLSSAGWSGRIRWSVGTLPPAMIAPAWPIRRPGGAVTPAMKETTGCTHSAKNTVSELRWAGMGGLRYCVLGGLGYGKRARCPSCAERKAVG